MVGLAVRKFGRGVDPVFGIAGAVLALVGCTLGNLLTIYAALTGRTIDELVEAYVGKGYGDLKKDLGEVVADFVRPVQERTRGYLDDPGQLDKVLAIGAEKARAVASATLRTVYKRVGFVPAARIERAGPPAALTGQDSLPAGRIG